MDPKTQNQCQLIGMLKGLVQLLLLLLLLVALLLVLLLGAVRIFFKAPVYVGTGSVVIIIAFVIVYMCNRTDEQDEATSGNEPAINPATVEALIDKIHLNKYQSISAMRRRISDFQGSQNFCGEQGFQAALEGDINPNIDKLQGACFQLESERLARYDRDSYNTTNIHAAKRKAFLTDQPGREQAKQRHDKSYKVIHVQSEPVINCGNSVQKMIVTNAGKIRMLDLKDDETERCPIFCGIIVTSYYQIHKFSYQKSKTKMIQKFKCDMGNNDRGEQELKLYNALQN
ncbi:hypothetical protein IFM89_028957 [Coptis chinensis]|uniref:Uncharacterized protein n=1 Tax=Coptis chinensis TaxID=261450 RepID=A0A835MA11_9MAGN|nr:hypothetical protein IFM89_028957 [Coptis chinensis]